MSMEEKNNIPFIKLHHNFAYNLINKNEDFTKAEIKILIYILEKTYGFHKKKAILTNNYIAIELNLSQATVKRSIKSLQERNVIINHKIEKGYKNELSINFKYSEWILNFKSGIPEKQKTLTQEVKEQKKYNNNYELYRACIPGNYNFEELEEETKHSITDDTHIKKAN